MYHTFQALSATGEAGEVEAATGKSGKLIGSRRISTSNACLECRRRKIRCDGSQPCGQCQWYQHPEMCAYSKPAQRVVPSRKLVDRLQSQVDHCSSVLGRLFPGQDLDTLVSLPREELINLAVTLPTTSPSSGSEPASLFGREQPPHTSDGAESLDALEQAPDQDPETDEAKRHKDKVQGISDDVNGLSLSVDKQSSYVGVSSISAALKVIFKTAPAARPFIAQTYIETALPSRTNSPPPQTYEPDPHYLPPADVGHRLIESYFNHVHVLMPMIDEEQFWHTYLYGERRDPPWLALLNMVLALGSLSLSTCDKEDHIVYFQRARKHLDLETFGSGNLLILQALGLLSGYYLHYLNRPNEANCLMGATLRMATALGLHREYNDEHPGGASNSTGMHRGAEVPVDIRRRTWWSLFCLDAWGSTTTGRPSLGRMGPGITVQTPQISQQMSSAQYTASLRLLPIIHNVAFCKIATRVQDSLATRSLCRFDELFALDAELVRWHDDLPPILKDLFDKSSTTQPQRSNSMHQGSRPKSVTPSTASSSRPNPFDFSQPPERDNVTCPDVLKTPRAIMHWRYQNLRMLMHRPFLLAAALRKTPYASMSAEEKVAVSRCRVIAGQAISDINSTCQGELIAGWNAVWLMYQAVMVPIVSLYSYLSTPLPRNSTAKPDQNDNAETNSYPMTGNAEEADKWRQQIVTSMHFFDRMVNYSVAAKKSKDVVARLFEGSEHLREYNGQHYQQQHDFLQAQQQQHPAHNGLPLVDPVTAQPIDPSTFPFDFISAEGHAPDMPFSFPNELDQGQQAFGWGLSPGGDAAMNSFWDDMMWETFPMNPEAGGWGFQGLEQEQNMGPPVSTSRNVRDGGGGY